MHLLTLMSFLLCFCKKNCKFFYLFAISFLHFDCLAWGPFWDKNKPILHLTPVYFACFQLPLAPQEHIYLSTHAYHAQISHYTAIRKQWASFIIFAYFFLSFLHMNKIRITSDSWYLLMIWNWLCVQVNWWRKWKMLETNETACDLMTLFLSHRYHRNSWLGSFRIILGSICMLWSLHGVFLTKRSIECDILLSGPVIGPTDLIWLTVPSIARCMA